MIATAEIVHELAYIPSQRDLEQGMGLTAQDIVRARRVIERFVDGEVNAAGELCVPLPPFVEVADNSGPTDDKRGFREHLLTLIHHGIPVVSWTFQQCKEPLLSNETEAARIALLIMRMGKSVDGSIYCSVDAERRDAGGGPGLGTDFNLGQLLELALFEAGLPVSRSSLPRDVDLTRGIILGSADGVVLKKRPLPDFLLERAR